MKGTICHRDGTVSYWSVYEQSYQVRVRAVRDKELAAMDQRTRDRVIAHLARYEAA